MSKFCVLLLAAAGLYGQAPAGLSVDAAVDEALKNNLNLLAERQNVPVSKAREIQAALRPNPMFTFAWDYMDWLRRGLNAQNSAGPSEWNAHVDYPIEGGGKRARRVDVAKLATSVAELRLLDSFRQLTLSVRQAATDYLAAQEGLRLARQNLEVFNGILKVNEAKVKAGELAGVELIRTRVAQQQFQTALDQAALRLENARNNLQQLLGRKQKDRAFEVTGALRDDPQIVVLDELKSQALAQRPDLLALRKDTERAAADIRLQAAIGKPDYTVSSIYHHQYGYSDGRTFGVFFMFPLTLYNRNQGEIARAQRETGQTEMRARALEQSIGTEVENAYRQYATARSLLEHIRGQLIGEAKQVRDITEFSYRRGEASLLEFLDAQRAYNDAVQSYNDARADYTKSLYLIDAVTGRGIGQ